MTEDEALRKFTAIANRHRHSGMAHEQAWETARVEHPELWAILNRGAARRQQVAQDNAAAARAGADQERDLADRFQAIVNRYVSGGMKFEDAWHQASAAEPELWAMLNRAASARAGRPYLNRSAQLPETAERQVEAFLERLEQLTTQLGAYWRAYRQIAAHESWLLPPLHNPISNRGATAVERYQDALDEWPEVEAQIREFARELRKRGGKIGYAAAWNELAHSGDDTPPKYPFLRLGEFRRIHGYMPPETKPLTPR